MPNIQILKANCLSNYNVDWQKEAEKVMEVEKCIFMSKNKEEQFWDIWAGWMYFSYKITGQDS